MTYDMTGHIHLLSAIVSLLFGFLVFTSKKGTKQHKIFGYIYFASMLILSGTALMIYRLSGSFNILHIAALVSIVSISLGMWNVLLKRPKTGWLPGHYEFMVWSYIGLLAALVAESSTRIGMPMLIKAGVEDFHSWFWSTVGIATFFVIFGARLIWERNKKHMGKYHETYDRKSTP